MMMAGGVNIGHAKGEGAWAGDAARERDSGGASLEPVQVRSRQLTGTCLRCATNSARRCKSGTKTGLRVQLLE